MPKKKVSPIVEQETAALESQINLSGAGEDQAVKDLLSPEFATMTDTQAFDIALALQRIVRGQSALLENQKQFSEELTRMREKFARYDEDAKKWNEDREKFILEQRQKADSLRITDPDKKASFQAKQSQYIQTQMVEARAQALISGKTARQKFEQELLTQPKVTVSSPGNLIVIKTGDGTYKSVIEDEVIRIRHKAWRLPAGRSVEVPLAVYNVWKQKHAVMEETDKRAAALQKDTSSVEVASQWKHIDEEYGITSTPEVQAIFNSE